MSLNSPNSESNSPEESWSPKKQPPSSNKRPAPRGTAAYPRKRAVTACQTCRSRRTKCDNAKPSCSFCLKVGAQCVSSPVDMSSFDPASLQILEKLEGLERLVRQSRDVSNPTVEIDRPARDPRPRLHLIPQNVENVLNWPIFQNRFVEYTDLISLLASLKGGQVSTPASSSSAALIGELEPRSCRKLLDLFLRYVHTKNPILDEGKLRAMVHRVCLEGVGWDSESCLVLIVCALGTIATPLEGDQPSHYARTDDMTVAESYFKAAQRRMGPMVGKSGVLEAQCLFFAGVYQSHLLQPYEAWRFFLQALACCQEFNFALQSYSDTPASTSPGGGGAGGGSEREASLYWTCWKSERESRQDLNLPDFKIQDHAYPRQFPTPPMDDPDARNTGWYFYLAEISLRRLDIGIRDEIFHFRPRLDDQLYEELAETVEGFEARAEGWVQSLPPTMDLEDIISDGVLKFILRGHLNNCYEVIYWPFVEALVNSRAQSESVVIYARKGLQMHVDRLEINRMGFRHRHHGTWGMLRCCSRSALILCAASRNPDAKSLLPDNWQQAVISAIDMLRFWEDEVGDAKSRLRILRELLQEQGG